MTGIRNKIITYVNAKRSRLLFFRSIYLMYDVVDSCKTGYDNHLNKHPPMNGVYLRGEKICFPSIHLPPWTREDYVNTTCTYQPCFPKWWCYFIVVKKTLKTESFCSWKVFTFGWWLSDKLINHHFRNGASNTNLFAMVVGLPKICIPYLRFKNAMDKNKKHSEVGNPFKQTGEELFQDFGDFSQKKSTKTGGIHSILRALHVHNVEKIRIQKWFLKSW